MQKKKKKRKQYYICTKKKLKSTTNSFLTKYCDSVGGKERGLGFNLMTCHNFES